MHPAQRIFLQNAVSALEDAGYGGNKWRGENIGVYVGSIGQMEVTGYQHRRYIVKYHLQEYFHLE